MSNFRIKWICRRDKGARMIRIFRIMWETGVVGDGKGYSTKLSLALSARPFSWQREYNGWFITIAFVRLHLRRAYGGTFT